MMNFLVKTIANAGALAVAVWLVDKITLTGGSTGKKTGTLILVALVVRSGQPAGQAGRAGG
ncbi:hypothetical protein SFUMM280S_10288 [Streptomyces fumanus]